MPLHRMKVGELYSATRREWPDGITEMRYHGGQWEFCAFLGRPSAAEVEAFRTGPVRLGLADIDQCLFFLYDFGRALNGDSPFSWHRLLTAEPVPPRIAPPTRIALLMVLVDAADGIVRGLRSVTMSSRVSYAWTEAVRMQAAAAADVAAEDRRRAEVYARYSTAALMRAGMMDRAGEDADGAEEAARA